jgi:hypothetical protein
MGLLAGTVLGAGLGMLFAPRPGSELRSQLGEQTGRIRTTANDAYAQASDKVTQIVDRGREAYERARGGNAGGASTGGGAASTPGVPGAGTMSSPGTGTTGYSSDRG